MLEALTYITTEIHRAFKPMWHAGSPAEKAAATANVQRLLAPLEAAMAGDFLFRDTPTVADFYLFVMLLWAERVGVETPERLAALRDRLRARPPSARP
ncbi:glutathione S-transferase C-terminal domain-containing protein [Brevundimonas sp.]|uniref:glutathione S-transferase C-terminal domain-containing protein n=1 Tax=Brevundimonas sp. TaxID=1871086 RepID=UPI003F6F1825